LYSGNDDDAKANLRAADSHARRAIYDINDASVNYYLAEIAAFRKRYPINLSDVVPHYGDVIAAVREAKDAIDTVTNNVGRREDAYDKIRPHAESLKKAYDTLDACQQDAAAAVDAHNRTVLESQKQAQRFWIRLVATVTIGAASIVIAGLAFL